MYSPQENKISIEKNKISINKNIFSCFYLLIFYSKPSEIRVNPINLCSKKNSVAKRTRIYRIDTDTSLVGRYCLPDSSHYMLYKSRDFVPGYFRFARYWLPARSPVLLCPSEQQMLLFHINSHISDCFLLKNKMSKCNSTLPPRGSYRFDNQDLIGGGIRGGIRVELREVPP